MLSNPKIVLAGGVGSTRRALQALIRHRARVVGVLGLDAALAPQTSGYCRLDELARSSNIPYHEFRQINDPATVGVVQEWAPDLLMIVGLSQLVKPTLLAIPPRGTVGFHPTWLPEGRGRAPVAWLTLDGKPGAATFFLMDEGVDAGPILAQEPFWVGPDDYAGDVMAKLEAAIDRALDGWLPQLMVGEWEPRPQDELQATFYAKRAPEDGLLDWQRPAHELYALIRAAGRPHPGAYTFLEDHRLIVWRASLERHLPLRGVAGRIVHIENGSRWLTQTGDGLLWLDEIEIVPHNSGTKLPTLRVGKRFGYAPQDELFDLKQRIAALEAHLARLAARDERTER